MSSSVFEEVGTVFQLASVWRVFSHVSQAGSDCWTQLSVAYISSRLLVVILLILGIWICVSSLVCKNDDVFTLLRFC